MVPPLVVRRLVLLPLALLMMLVSVALVPLLLLLPLVTMRSTPEWLRALRLLWFGLAWLMMESATLIASLVLWIASGFGGRIHADSFQDRHYALVRWFLDTLFRTARRVFHLTVEIEEPAPTPQELGARLTRPVIVLSRHAGPGDSFLLIHHLLSRYGRRPRIVMKAALQLDPSIDVVINRLPHAFVAARRRNRVSPVVAEIRRLAAGLDEAGALVIFPEGANFTPRRRARGIARLSANHRDAEARRAERMANLLPPRSGGAYAAIHTAPSADVIFVAHTGLDDLVTVGDIWRALPMHQVIRVRWWRVPAEQVPQTREEVVGWLFDWWERIDRWIEENRPERTQEK